MEYEGLHWIGFNSDLSNRKHSVVTNGIQSDILELSGYGVPQGSVLGKILFLLFINDIHNPLDNIIIKLFADDTDCFVSGNDFNLLERLAETELKGQLQRFHKLISNDRIWPSEHGFEVIFEKSLFVFEISAFKVRNKHGIHSRFHSFSENNNRETLVCDVTSDPSSMISTERSDLRDCKASGNCYV